MAVNNNAVFSLVGIAAYYFLIPIKLENTILSSVKRGCGTCLLTMWTFLSWLISLNEQFWEALGHCITLSHSIIDIDATWFVEQYNLFCAVSIDLVQ